MASEAPFRVGGVVRPPHFIGREKEMHALLIGAKEMSQNYLILAAQRMGKSSLIVNVADKLKKEKKLIVAEINCLETESCEEFSSAIIEKVLAEYEAKYKLGGLLEIFKRSFKASISEILESIEKIGGTFKGMVEVYISFREKKIDERGLIKETFEFLEKFSSEKKIGIIIIFDEFQKVAEFDRFIFGFLKSHTDRTKNIRYIFSGSSMSLLKDIFLKPRSPLYLTTSKIYLGPIERERVEKFVFSRLALCKISIEEKALKNLVNLSGCIPFYFQKLGDICYKNAVLKGLKMIKEEDVKEAFESMLREFWPEFEIRFSFVFSPRQRAILKAIAAGNARASEIARALNLHITKIGKDLKELVDSLTINRTGRGKYEIQDKVFEKWLARMY